MDSVGLLPPFLEAAEYIRGARVYGEGLAELRAITLKGLGCRYQFQCSLPQYETQRILEAHALRVGTTEQVVKNYLRKVYDKLGVADRLELALYCLNHHVVDNAKVPPMPTSPANGSAATAAAAGASAAGAASASASMPNAAADSPEKLS